jgi:hypothetical protein
MAKYTVTSPDGKQYEVTGPAGASQQEVLQAVFDQLGIKPPAPERPDRTIMQEVSAGFQRSKERLGSSITDVLPAMLASKLGFEDYAKEKMADAAEVERQIQKYNPPSYQSFRDVEGPRSAIGYVAETLGESGPDILASLLPGGIGGTAARRLGTAGLRELGAAGAEQIARRGAMGEAAGVYLGSYAQNAPEIFQNIYQETGQLEPGVAMLFGSVNAALDSVLPASILRSMSQPVRVGVVEKILERSGMEPGLLRKVVAQIPGNVARESLTEGGQETIGLVAEDFVKNTDHIWGSKEWDRIVDATIRGGIAGGTFGVPGSVAERVREKAEEPQRMAEDIASAEEQLAREIPPPDETVPTMTTKLARNDLLQAGLKPQSVYIRQLADKDLSIPEDVAQVEATLAKMRMNSKMDPEVLASVENVIEAYKTEGGPAPQRPALTTIPYDTVQFAGEGKPLQRSSGKADIIDYGGRKIVMREVNGVMVPFYLSTGRGGKKDSASGKWYPFFGIGADGWINKTSGKEMSDYYGSKALRQAAEELDSTIGDIRDDKSIPGVGKSGQHIDFINQGLSPAENGQANTLTQVRQNIDSILSQVESTTVAPTPTEVIQEEAPTRALFSAERKKTKERIPELEALAQGVVDGTVTKEQYDEGVKAFKPVTPYKDIPAPATEADLNRSLSTDKRERIYSPREELEEGYPVGLRLDIPAYTNHGVWAIAVHEQQKNFNAGKSIGYDSVAAITNPTFGAVEKAALSIASGKAKSTIAVVKGNWKPVTEKQAVATAQAALKDKSWTQVGMDPTRHAYFYDRKTGQPVVSGDEAIMVGPLVLVKNPIYAPKDQFLFSQSPIVNAAPNERGMKRDAVERAVQNIKRTWTNAPKHVTVQSVRDLPKELREQAERDGVNPRGVYDPDSQVVYLVADNIANPGQAAIVLAHEALGHFGLRVVLGKNFNKMMDDLYRTNKMIRQRADEKIKEGDDQRTAVEEVLAEMAEEVYDLRVPENKNKLSALQKVINVIKQFLRRLGVPAGAITDQEVIGLIANARKAVVEGPVRAAMPAKEQARYAGDTRTPEFRKWFGNSKVVDENGRPKRMYHGTGRDIEEFRPKQAGAIFLTDDPVFAESFAGMSENYMQRNPREFFTEAQIEQFRKEGAKVAKAKGTDPIDEYLEIARNNLPSNANILPVYVSAQNPFDFENPDHIRAIEAESTYALPINEIITGTWNTIETPRIQELIKAAGFDGFYVQEGGRKNLAVYNSNQIKSVFNERPTESSKILYSKRATNIFNGLNQQVNNLPGMNSQLADDFKNAMSNVPDKVRSAALGFLTMPQIQEIYGTALPSLKKLTTALEARASDMMERRQHISKNIQDWYKVANKHKAQLPRFFAIANRTTLDQIDVLDPAEANNPLTKEFEKLHPDLQKVYKQLRDDYKKSSDEYMHLLLSNLKQSQASVLRLKMEAKRLKVYLPLFRMGDYWVSFNDKNDERVSMAFESVREAKQAAEKARADGMTDVKEFTRLQQITYRTVPPTGFMGSVVKQLQDQGVKPEVIDSIYQTYLSLFPAQSVRQQFRKREGRLGFREDVFQVYANVATRMANQLANMKNADPLEKAVTGVRQEFEQNPTMELRDVVDNMQKQLDFIRNPVNGDIVNKASYFSYMWFIAGNVSSALVNLTQMPIVVYPLLGGRFGFGRAYDAMRQATALYWKGGKDNNSEFLPDWTFGAKATGELKQLYDVAVQQQAIRRSTGYEITEARKSKVEDFTGKRAQIEHGLGWIFQNSERANREITLIAAFKLAREGIGKAPGMSVDGAIDYAISVVNDAHGASLAEIGPRYFQQGIGKVAFTFKRFAQAQIYLMGRLFHQAFKSADKDTRDIARKQLLGIAGTSYIFAGIQGMPLYGAVSVLANMLADDDDEPFDMDATVRAAFGDIGYKGPVNALLAVDIASRTGFNGLVWRDDPKRLAEIGPTLYAIEQAAGPAYGAFRNAERGLKLVQEGEWQRGMEALMPSFVRNGLKAFRLGTEGAMTKDGVPITDDIGAYNVFMQIFGFNPAELAEAQARAGAEKRAERAIMDRRASLLEKAYLARQQGDNDGLQDVMEAIGKFNAKNPEVDIDAKTLRNSFMTRQRHIAESVDGVYLNPKLRNRLMETYGGGED